MNEKLVKQLLEELQQTTQDPRDIGKLNITNIIIWMKKEAYEPTTIQRVVKELKHLERNCDTARPEEVKFYIAKKECSNGHKQNLIEAYAMVIKSLGFTWEQPFYTRYSKKRRAPKEELINFIIQHTRIEMATKLAIIKDVGTRPKELTWLTIKDIDLDSGVVSITGAKHTIGREGKLKQKSLTLLKILIETKKLTQSSRLYNGTSDNLSANYRHYRNRIAKEFNMPELKQVQLYNFRRFKASKLSTEPVDVYFVNEVNFEKWEKHKSYDIEDSSEAILDTKIDYSVPTSGLLF